MSRKLILAASLAALSLAGCAGNPNLAGSGPSRDQVAQASVPAESRIKVVDLTPEVARQAKTVHGLPRFDAAFSTGEAPAYVIGKGDLVEVSIWEAQPAALFGVATLDATIPSSRGVTLPAQMVSQDGEITVPFVGRVAVLGKSAKAVEKAVLDGLRGKAHQPQAVVRIAQNATFDVTVVGEVTHSGRVPLTARGERLLDAVAAAGGVKEQTGKVTLQIARNGQVQAVPLAAVIRDPAQNVILRPGDVVTALTRPYSFTAMGAVSKNDEINFEATGLTLAQGLARVGGVLDSRADASGVFLFRQEDRAALPAGIGAVSEVDGKVPVIYRVDLRDPRSFLVMQDFPVKDKDVLYVANAPLADLQKFMGVIASIIYPVANLRNLAQ